MSARFRFVRHAVARNVRHAWPWWLGLRLMWPVRYIPRTSLFFDAFREWGMLQLLGCALAFLALLAAARPCAGCPSALRARVVRRRGGCVFGVRLHRGRRERASPSIGYAAIGAAHAGFLALWHRAFGGMRAVDVMVCLALASVGLAVVDSALLLLPDQVARSLMVLLPLASPALLCRTLPLAAPACEKGPRRGVKGADAGYYVLAVVVGCAFGFMSKIVCQGLRSATICSP